MIHNYSYHGNPDDDALSQSGATLTVYTSTGESYTYEVPSGEGNIWEVITVEDGKIKEINDIIKGDINR